MNDSKLQELLQYKDALDQASIVAATNTAGTILYVNEKFCEISGYSSEELIGKNHRIVNSGFHPKMFWENMYATIYEGCIWRGEIRNRTKSGKIYWVDTTIVPFKNEDGEIEKFVAIRSEITQKKELELEVLRADRMASIGLLASGLAHEIGTPLGVIRGRAELIKMRLEERPNETKDLDTIIGQIDRISSLIHSLLKLSRSNSEINLEDVFLFKPIEDVLLLIGQNFRQEGIEVQLKISKRLTVRADSARLQQVFLNLFMNAIQAITSSKSGKPKILKVYAIEHSEMIELHVVDSGDGVLPENRAKLFQPFFTTKEIGQGTGLGLSIVFKLISEMNGVIEFVSDQSETNLAGAHFRIKLPPGRQNHSL
jgi:PAS domain S-box-containing protein